MKIEIEVDLGEYAADWEAVAFRVPLNGEWILALMGQPLKVDHESFTRPRLVIRKKWKWPEWLLAHWIWKSEHGGWLASFEEPMLQYTPEGKAYWEHGRTVPLYKDVFDFTPPTCDDFTKSKMRNPNLS